GVARHVRSLARIALTGGAAHRVGRQEELHALQIAGGGAGSQIHVAAADPPGARRHADLVGAVKADDGAHGVGAVALVIARLRIVVAAGAGPGMDRVVPVVVMARRGAVPAAVGALERRVGPPV